MAVILLVPCKISFSQKPALGTDLGYCDLEYSGQAGVGRGGEQLRLLSFFKPTRPGLTRAFIGRLFTKICRITP